MNDQDDPATFVACTKPTDAHLSRLSHRACWHCLSVPVDHMIEDRATDRLPANQPLLHGQLQVLHATEQGGRLHLGQVDHLHRIRPRNSHILKYAKNDRE